MHRLSLLSLAFLMLLIAAQRCGAAERPAREFKLGQYVKGTPAQIRQTLQGPVDEFTAKAKDAKERVAECEAAVVAAREAALPRARASAKYRELAAAAKQAEQDLERARRSGTTQERLDASSRLNRSRAAMDQIEKDAITGDRGVAAEEARLAEERQSLERCRDSLKKATASRDQWVYAIECTFRINAPLAVGSEGVLTTVRVLKPPAPDHEGLLVLYEAAERVGLGADVEGIQTVNVVMKKERLLLAPDTPGAEGAKRGDVLKLFRCYRVASVAVDREGSVYVTARVPDDVDSLMAEVMSLREK